MQITIDTSDLRPSTIAIIIADMLETRSPYNNAQIKALLAHLEILVGEDESIEFLVDSGITPEQLVEVWHEADA